MGEVKHTPWTVEDCGSPEYLDGIQSRYTVHGRGKIPIAYAFDAHEARLIASAPELLAALLTLMPRRVCLTNANVPDSMVIPCDVTVGELRAASAAIARATQSPATEGGE
jgi:hypothetical protein